jgi:hypothetical protein
MEREVNVKQLLMESMKRNGQFLNTDHLSEKELKERVKKNPDQRKALLYPPAGVFAIIESGVWNDEQMEMIYELIKRQEYGWQPEHTHQKEMAII